MDERSERLRKRRKRSTSQSNGRSQREESGESADSSGSSEPSKPSTLDADRSPADEDPEDEDPEDEEGSIPVKEQQIGTYMYLPETQVKHLRRQYNVLKAEYEFQYDEEFEKNRHFYPLVVQYGLERLDELDTAQIRSLLEEVYE